MTSQFFTLLAINPRRDIHDYLDIYLDPIIVIGTFVLGYIVSNQINKNQERRRLTRVYDFFLHYLKNQFLGISNQVEVMKNYKNQIENLQGFSNVSIVTVSQPFFLLDSIKLEDLFSSWIDIKKRNVNELFEILRFMDFTRSSFKSYIDNHRAFGASQSQLSEKWNIKIAEFHTLKTELTKVPSSVIHGSIELQKLLEIYKNWSDNVDESDSVKDVIKSLVKPLLEFYEPIYGKDSNNHTALSLIKIAQEIDIIHIMWHAQVINNSKLVGGMIKAIEDNYEIVKTKAGIK